MPWILLSVTLTQGVLTLSLIQGVKFSFPKQFRLIKDIWIVMGINSSINTITGSKYHLHFINWHFGNQANIFKIFYLLTPSPPFLQLRNLQDIMRMFITPIMQFRSLFVIVKISGQEYFWNQSRYFTTICKHRNMMDSIFSHLPFHIS